jgi:hypothetical protein
MACSSGKLSVPIHQEPFPLVHNNPEEETQRIFNVANRVLKAAIPK